MENKQQKETEDKYASCFAIRTYSYKLKCQSFGESKSSTITLEQLQVADNIGIGDKNKFSGEISESISQLLIRYAFD